MLAACGSQPGGPARTFDPCEPVALAAPGASAEQLASIDDAIALWRARGITAFAVTDAPQVTIVFRDAAPSLYGFYDDTTATVYINTALVDPSERAITIAHELGHSLALVHVPAAQRASVMNPGNVTVTPTDGDVAALAQQWGACPTP